MRLTDAFEMIINEMGPDDVVGNAVDELYHMIDMALPAYLEEDLPDFPSSIDDLDMVLFDLAESLVDLGNPCFTGVASLLQGLAHLKMSQDGSNSETTWVHDPVKFCCSGVHVPLSVIHCPSCGEDVQLNEVVQDVISGDRAVPCGRCGSSITVNVVSVTTHVESCT